MGSRNREQTTTSAAAPLLSSLVVRLTNNERTADFEPGEVSRDPPPPSSYSRSARFYQDPPPPRGYRVHAGSVSPVRRRNGRHFNYTVDHSDANAHRGRGRGRDPGRYQESPPRFSRGRGFDRSVGRGSAGHRLHPGNFRSDTTGKSNPNVEPREGDWYCSDPVCNNLNFARRDHCNNCHRPRGGTELSPRRGHLGPPPPLRRFSGMSHSPRRATNGLRSPPRMARNYGVDLPTERDRRGDRFAEHHIRRDQPGYLDDGFDQRSRFERREQHPIGYASRENIRGGLYIDRKGYDRRLSSPPLPSIHPPPPVAAGRWARDRSRSPILLRDELPLKDYRHGSYGEHERNERHGPSTLSERPHSPRAVSGRWVRGRSRSPILLRNDLPSKDYRRGSNGENERNEGHDPSALPQSPRAVPGRWVRDRSRSQSPILLRDELPLKDYRRASYGEHERNERHGLPLSELPQSPRAVSGRWARERSTSPLRNELSPLKDYHRGRDAYMTRGRDDRDGGLSRGRDAY